MRDFPPVGFRPVVLTLHSWEPHGKPYGGLPMDDAEARRRREERLVSKWLDSPVEDVALPPAKSLSPYCLDLRWL